ncbi:MAG: GNAT family N-acetyltransferase [Hamadaea sp.]|nr:GNAT family N-acetyltransferase [Hamadaea sp.]
MHLELLTAEHEAAILAFETRNRAYFAASVPDRGDEFFADYPARHAALLAMQAAGTDRFHVVLADDGAIAGRVNLMDIRDGDAELGYRIGQDHTGRGVATAAVREVCVLAGGAYGLRRLHAGTAKENHASQAVLRRNGFVFDPQSGEWVRLLP